MKKRIFTLLLSLLLLIGACPAALAEDAAPWAGAGTSEQPYELPDIDALTLLKDNVNAGNSYSGVYFKMTGDITLPADWTPMGTEASPFSGVFDGGGNLLTVAEGGRCLFNYVSGFTVTNLNIYGPRIAGNGLVDNLTRGVGYGTIDHVTLKSGTQTLKSGFLGGLGPGDTVDTVALTSMTQTFTISNCTAESGVVIGYNKDQDCIGSFCGRVNAVMTNCTSSAEVYGRERVGGLIGTKDNAMGEFSVKNCAFNGSVTASGEYCGGIVGVGYTHETAPNTLCMVIENCTCGGTVTGTSCVGGITGGEGGLWQAWDNGIGRICGNRFTGKISGSRNVGGIVGYIRGLDVYNVFENNSFSSDCGAVRGLGGTMYVDSSIYGDGSSKPIGWQEVEGWGKIYCFDSSEDSLARIKYDLNPSSSYYNIAKSNHNRDDDILGEDGWALLGGTDPSPFNERRTKVQAENVKSGKIKLTWKAVSGAAQYKVLVADSADGEYKLAKETEELTCTYGGQVGQKYYFKVVAVNKKGRESAESEAVGKFRLPDQVKSLKAKSTKAKQVTLTWKKVTGAKNYIVYMSKNGKSGWKKIGTAKTNKFTYKKAAAGKKLYFKVQAVSSSGKKGAFSSVKSCKVKK